MKKIQIPTPNDWFRYFNFRRNISIQKIVDNSFDQEAYDKAIEKTKETLEKTIEVIEDCNKIYKKLKKSLKRGI